MNCTRAGGLIVILAVALMLPAASSPASQLTSPIGTIYTGEIKAGSEGHLVIHSENAPTAFTTECEGSIAGKVIQHGADPTTAISELISLTFNGCTNGATFVVSKPGFLEFHTDTSGKVNSNGTVTSSGAEITHHVPVLNIKCVYTTSNTPVGTLTGSAHLKEVTKLENTRATLDINSATIPRTGGSAFCGTGSFWTGSYKVSTPDYLDVD